MNALQDAEGGTGQQGRGTSAYLATLSKHSLRHAAPLTTHA